MIGWIVAFLIWIIGIDAHWLAAKMTRLPYDRNPVVSARVFAVGWPIFMAVAIVNRVFRR